MRAPIVTFSISFSFSLSLFLVLLTLSLWAQSSHADKTDKAAIDLAKNSLVSSLDRRLPKVSLEFFLRYEGEDAPIRWVRNDCGEQTGNPAAENGRDLPTCVEAEVELKNDASLVIFVAVGTVAKGLSSTASFFSATITDSAGVRHSLRRLGDLPKELHRPVPKGPRDLPLPMG